MAKLAERKANRRRTFIAADEAVRIKNSWAARGINFMQEQFDAEVTVWTNRAASNDPTFKGHVADNQWYIQQAIMFGNAATEHAIRDLIKELRQNDPRK